MLLDVESFCNRVSNCSTCWTDNDGGIWCWVNCIKHSGFAKGDEELIKDITKQEALRLLSSGKEVWVLNEATRTFVPLLDAINGTLIAEVTSTSKEVVSNDKQAEEPVTAAKSVEKKREPLDVGKVRALVNAKWSVPKIADEMDVSPATIYYHLKKMGLKE
jgi:hypothetical protein